MSDLFLFITVLQTIVAASMVGVILMQRSEGGALGVGGSPNGLMSARGAGDFLTRATAILATAFVLLSVVLAVLAANVHSTSNIDTSLERNVAAPAGDPLADPLSAPTGTPANGDPLSAAGAQTGQGDVTPAAPATSDDTPPAN